MKRVRMLLRVSSNQQLEADGDLSVQRQLVKEYAESHSDWVLDEKEYFEGSNSGYKNSVADRDVLQEALQDAGKREYDILVAYKDDRVGRRMWEIGAYVMTLKSNGVDIYTVKDGCISPETDDIMGQMMLALRYGNAQKSSADTGMRVKDTAQKLVQKGKFMGGAAPYGYRLELSGEISKHGRALHHLVIVQEEAEVVRYIYRLSLNREYGSGKIAKLLNEEERYRALAPNDIWKSGTVTSILTNPVYAGYVAYKRRERIHGKYHRLDGDDWIKALVPDERIRIIDEDTWNRTQDKRKGRSDKYRRDSQQKNIIRKSNGTLALIDVVYCGYCGEKLTNGTRYNYWTIKGTGERRARKIPMYRCRSAEDDASHNKSGQFRADRLEKIVYEYLGEYISCLQEKEDIRREIRAILDKEDQAMEAEIRKQYRELERTICGIGVMQSHIPEAMTGNYTLRVEELANAIHAQQEREQAQRQRIREKEKIRKEMAENNGAWEELQTGLPTWKQVFEEADCHIQRVLVNKLIERIDITQELIVIRFKINLNDCCLNPE